MGRKKETIYLAYGSNMNQTQMAFRCPTAEVVGTGELKGYELLFRGVPRCCRWKWMGKRCPPWVIS